MNPKKERTIDEYKKVGAMMRLYKTLGVKLATELSKVMPAAEMGKMRQAIDKVNSLSSRAEDNMFHDFPELESEYIDVFYGTTKMEPRNVLDAEMIERARQVANDLFQ